MEYGVWILVLNICIITIIIIILVIKIMIIIQRGSINSLFGYKLTTPEAIAEIVKLRTTLFGDEEECEERLPVEKCFKTTNELSL